MVQQEAVDLSDVVPGVEDVNRQKEKDVVAEEVHHLQQGQKQFVLEFQSFHQ